MEWSSQGGWGWGHLKGFLTLLCGRQCCCPWGPQLGLSARTSTRRLSMRQGTLHSPTAGFQEQMSPEREPGGSCVTLSSLASGVTQHPFCHILLVRSESRFNAILNNTAINTGKLLRRLDLKWYHHKKEMKRKK